MDCLAVGIGGFIGSVCRYLVGKIPIKNPAGFPINTFLINIAGAFVIGCLAAAAAKNSDISPRLMLFLKVGLWRRIHNLFHIFAGNRNAAALRQCDHGSDLYCCQCRHRHCGSSTAAAFYKIENYLTVWRGFVKIKCRGEIYGKKE